MPAKQDRYLSKLEAYVLVAVDCGDSKQHWFLAKAGTSVFCYFIVGHHLVQIHEGRVSLNGKPMVVDVFPAELEQKHRLAFIWQTTAKQDIDYTVLPAVSTQVYCIPISLLIATPSVCWQTPWSVSFLVGTGVETKL